LVGSARRDDRPAAGPLTGDLVTIRRRFGELGISGQIAMLSHSQLVLKLYADRVAELISAGQGTWSTPFARNRLSEVEERLISGQTHRLWR
jgi:hypothetical protein